MRSAALLVLVALPSLAADLIRGPYLQLADATGITVVFRTDTLSVGAVRLSNGVVVTELMPSIDHTVRLSGLTPSTRYGYEVTVDGVTVAGGDAFHFRTHPATGTASPFRLFAWGDSGLGTVDQLRLAERLSTEVGDATLSLVLGDLVYFSGEAELYDARYFAPYAPLLRRMVAWTTIGNHDMALDPLGGPYIDAFVLPTNNPLSTELYYSFDYGDAHFVCLDTHVSGHAAGSAQLQWAAADLAASTAKWKFVFFHVPPFSGGTHPDDPQVIAGIVPLVEAAGVDVVFSGHSHAYERTYLLKGSAIVQADPVSYLKASPDAGTLYVVSGTAGQTGALANPTHPLMAYQAGNVFGASVIDVSGDTLHGYFLRDDGVAVDLFQLTKGVDTVAPRLIAARALSPMRVELSFDEPVTAASAEMSSAWGITPSVGVTAVRLGSDRRTVQLDTTVQANGRYSVAATGVADGSGNLSSSVRTVSYEVVPEVVLTSGALQFLVPTSGTPTGWTARAFDDSSWTAGTLPIGYGSSGLTTTTSLGAEVTLYTRAHFTPAIDVRRLRALTLELDYDDGFVAFLNGVEISRQNVPAGQGRGAVATASREPGLVEHRLVAAPPAGVLVQGDNVLAIEVHNVSAASSDLFLSARLLGVLDDELDAGVADAGLPDAGGAGPDDGGVDAGADDDGGTLDAGLSDGGPGDAGRSDGDAGFSDAGLSDAGAEPDAGASLGPGGGGCSCDGSSGALMSFLLGALLLRRRRA